MNYLNIVIILQKNKKNILKVKIGTEEQSGTTNNPEELTYTLKRFFNLIIKRKF